MLRHIQTCTAAMAQLQMNEITICTNAIRLRTSRAKALRQLRYVMLISLSGSAHTRYGLVVVLAHSVNALLMSNTQLQYQLDNKYRTVYHHFWSEVEKELYLNKYGHMIQMPLNVLPFYFINYHFCWFLHVVASNKSLRVNVFAIFGRKKNKSYNTIPRENQMCQSQHFCHTMNIASDST